MAASGAMADFARMPPQRKVLVFALIGAVLGLAYWKLAYKSLDEQLDEAQAEHDNKVATNQKLAADLPLYEELRTRMTKLRELIEKNQTALPSAPELPAFFETLQHKVAESGVEIHKWTNRGEEPIETFVKVPVDIEISGTFMQIKRFFASLIQHDIRPGQADDAADDRERVVSIENLALATPTVRNREILLTAKFTAVTFRQEDRAVPIKPATPAPGGRPGTPPTITPAAPPPPLPSATTPAGAKARVENALDKGEARNRGAADAADGKPAGAKPGATGSDRLKGGL
ncbi:MAG: hypothetical protein E6J90_12250 [Deltaproteobacteria bacterium]|nr:MAG: hypothetical protein E6J90_12250 [Deltaproteobacteria bacterium]